MSSCKPQGVPLNCCLKLASIAKTSSQTLDWFSVCTCKIILGFVESDLLIFTIAKARANGSLPEKKKMKVGRDPNNCWRFSLSGKMFSSHEALVSETAVAPLSPAPSHLCFTYTVINFYLLIRNLFFVLSVNLALKLTAAKVSGESTLE